MAAAEVLSESSRHWSTDDIRLLIITRLGHEQEFSSGRRKKCVLWSNILREMMETNKNFSYTRDECMKKYSNLLLTYNRIKKRNSQTGRNATVWEFFNLLDNVYGTRHCISPPASQMCSTLVAEDEHSGSMEEVPCQEESPVRAPSKKPKNEILEFLKKEAVEDERRHEEYLQMERNRAENDKEKIAVEREKVKEVRELKEILQKLLG